MAIDGYLVTNITSNVIDNSPNTVISDTNLYPHQRSTIQSSLTSLPHVINDVIKFNNQQDSNALSWHIPRPSLISLSQENSIYGSLADYNENNNNQKSESTTSVKNKAGVHRGFGNYWNINRESTCIQSSTSSSSTNSTQSAKSGSLLLTVANLTKVDQDHLKTTHENPRDQHATNLQYFLEQNQNKLINTNIPKNCNIIFGKQLDTEISITGMINKNKNKDLDSYSIASSTHFTVVNGLDRHRNKITQNNNCCQKHKLTVLILTMSSIFMFGIIVAVYLFEMRAMNLRNTTL